MYQDGFTPWALTGRAPASKSPDTPVSHGPTTTSIGQNTSKLDLFERLDRLDRSNDRRSVHNLNSFDRKLNAYGKFHPTWGPFAVLDPDNLQLAVGEPVTECAPLASLCCACRKDRLPVL